MTQPYETKVGPDERWKLGTIDQRKVVWTPQPDITAYELARLFLEPYTPGRDNDTSTD